jgi:hypothetical protein
VKYRRIDLFVLAKKRHTGWLINIFEQVLFPITRDAAQLCVGCITATLSQHGVQWRTVNHSKIAV